MTDTFPACHSNLWDHINGWEVVLAAWGIIAGWAAVSVAHYYFMAKIAGHIREQVSDDDKT